MAGALSHADSEALDGLRGLAALIVVFSHAGGMGLALVPGLSFAGAGKYGVYLFFVLSAFLLTLQWLEAAPVQRRDPRHWGAYALRRVLRIYPLYTLVLLAAWLLPPRGLGVPITDADLLPHLALQAGHDIYWSIPVEFAYYLVIPPLALLLVSLPAAWALGALAGLTALALWRWPGSQAPLNSITLGYYLPIFLAGSGVAWWHCHQRARRPDAADAVATTGPRRASPWDALALVALLATVPAVIGWWRPQTELDVLHRVYLGWGVALGLLLWALLRGHLPLWRRALRSRLLRACGHWCFGIYLLHLPGLALAKRLLPGQPLLAGWLGLVLALLLAAAAHRVVERPFMRLGRSLRR